MSAAAGPAWFKVYAVYMVIGFVALMLSYFGTKEADYSNSGRNR